jgi:hypothetical protein
MRSILFTIFLFGLCGLSLSLGCQKNSDCFSVSANINYAECQNGTCICPVGFAGSATPAAKCDCLAPKEIITRGGQFYCIDLNSAIVAVAEDERCDILKAKVQRVYESIIYPLNLAVITGQVSQADLFDQHVDARITPLGVYHDYEGVIEYFYGLATLPTNIVYDTNMRLMTCDGNTVQFRIDIFFNQTLSPVADIPIVNVTHWGKFTFNDQNLISKIDVTFPNLGATVDIPNEAPFIELAPGVNFPLKRYIGIVGTCTVLNQTCIGANQNYPSIEACTGFMLSKPFGSFDRAFSDTYTCRSVHMLLTPFRPEIHCVHAGVTGGDKCIDFPASSYYTNDDF